MKCVTSRFSVERFPRGIVTVEYILLVAVLVIGIACILHRVFLGDEPMPKKILETITEPIRKPAP